MNTPPLNSTERPKLKKPYPNLELSLNQPASQPKVVDPSMAFQRAHLGPFKPRGMHVEEVPNRPTMVRVVAERRPWPRNEDLAIVTISPVPGNPLHFPTVEEVVRELLEEHKGIQVKEVQPYHLVQAYVRFEHDRDRDRMVLESPHRYGGVNFTFVRHNQGRNWRRVNFNQDCWLMLLGFPNDYWEREYVDTIMDSWVRLARLSVGMGMRHTSLALLSRQGS